MTDLTKSQLAAILSALDGEPRRPANRDAALEAITRSAQRLGLGLDEVLAAAPGLLDSRLSPEHWRAELVADAAPQPVPEADEPDATVKAPRAGTKQAMLIAMLHRPEGADVQEIAEATGWQKHTVRGAIAGALKKKLGLTITSTKDGQGRRAYRIAQG